MRNSRLVLLAIVCLAITGRGVSWADAAQGAPAEGAPAEGAPAEGAPAVDPERLDWVDNPYAPHVTRGSTVRLGTAVGFLYGEPIDTMAVGLTTAIGQRFGRLAIEAEAAVFSLKARGASELTLGNAERLGSLARFDVIRIGSEHVGPNSMLAIYVEGGAAVAWNHWYPPTERQAPRAVPGDTKRVEGQAGFGIEIDHRLQQPIGFPHRIGWFLGWRIALAPADSEPDTACRSVDTICRTVGSPMPSSASGVVARSMVFQSSLSVTW
ncbi:MAG TPA: hypothetical protein VHW23_09820 [Kofleriaceae bacterium]|nr:hypothetical protein [Kofleriaceae bacterium]